MPNIKSAEKRMRLSRVQNTRNRQARARLRTAIKKVRTAETTDAAQSAYREVQALLDRAGQSRLMHPKRSARLKSQLAQLVTSLA
jgi:small subunit ribosomal protein S20